MQTNKIGNYQFFLFNLWAVPCKCKNGAPKMRNNYGAIAILVFSLLKVIDLCLLFFAYWVLVLCLLFLMALFKAIALLRL